jgi:hypothetical protein
MRSNFFSLFGMRSTRHLKVGQEECVKVYACRISIKSVGAALKDMTLVGGIRLNCKGFKANSLMPVIFAKKVLQKYLVHNRG